MRGAKAKDVQQSLRGPGNILRSLALPRLRGDDGARRRDAALFFPGVCGRAKDGRCQIVRRVCFAGGAFGKANAERLLKARKQLDALEAAEAKVAIEVR